ncbi:hypothetical protein [Chromobacterium phragmitis]|uniref:hypothetical protein n=1 Tax=Chromobacterium phragmitis TaxID=2202141 RepID=UPI0011AE27BE|nr:hypothetical protein [Chromobacterium phragmitis]
MSSKVTQARAQNGDLSVAVQHHETDSPLLPVDQLERLNQIDPNLVRWVVDQTQAEAEHRRREHSKTNIFIFIERMGGLIGAAVIGLSGMLGGSYVSLHGQPWAGASIAGVTIGTLAVAFITGRKPKSVAPPPGSNSKK